MCDATLANEWPPLTRGQHVRTGIEGAFGVVGPQHQAGAGGAVAVPTRVGIASLRSTRQKRRQNGSCLRLEVRFLRAPQLVRYLLLSSRVLALLKKRMQSIICIKQPLRCDLHPLTMGQGADNYQLQRSVRAESSAGPARPELPRAPDFLCHALIVVADLAVRPVNRVLLGADPQPGHMRATPIRKLIRNVACLISSIARLRRRSPTLPGGGISWLTYGRRGRGAGSLHTRHRAARARHSCQVAIPQSRILRAHSRHVWPQGRRVLSSSGLARAIARRSVASSGAVPRTRAGADRSAAAIRTGGLSRRTRADGAFIIGNAFVLDVRPFGKVFPAYRSGGSMIHLTRMPGKEREALVMGRHVRDESLTLNRCTRFGSVVGRKSSKTGMSRPVAGQLYKTGT